MATKWVVRLYFFVPVSAVDATLRDMVADAFANNASGETALNERKLVNTLARLSTSGNEPAQALALNSAVKLAMRTAIRTIIQAVPQNAWYVVSNVNGLLISETPYNEGELIAFGGRAQATGRVGTPFTFAEAVADLGLQAIEVPAE